MSAPLHSPKYNPHLAALAALAIEDWGNPKENTDGLIPYPGGPDSILNKALYGIDIKNGELIGIIGMEKARKTTFAMAICHSIMMGKTPIKPRIAYLTLESGQPPSRIRDLFISMCATDTLIKSGYLLEATLSPEYLRYKDRTPIQQRAITKALQEIIPWPLYVYGPHKDQGNTRNPGAIKAIMEYEASQGCRLIILDHAQQVEVEGSSSMQQLYAVVGLFAGATVTHGMAGILISQVSLGSVRGSKEGVERLRAVGGKRLDEEANAVFITTSGATPDKLIITLVASRRAPPFGVKVTLNPSSGLFIGEQEKCNEFLYSG